MSLIVIKLLLTWMLSCPLSVSSSIDPSQTQALLNLQTMLEYPSALQSWTQQTDFCNLPPSPQLTIFCEQGFITHLQIVGNRASPSTSDASDSTILSPSFSSDSLTLQLSYLSRLKVLQLSSLGLWGPLSSKLGRLPYLQILNFTSNFLSGKIPNRLTFLHNLQMLLLDDNLLNGSLPQLWNSLPSLNTLSLSNNKLQGLLPSSIFTLPSLKTLLLDNNLLSGAIPESLSGAYNLQALSLAENRLSGNLPDLTSLRSLEAFNVQNNQIGPQFPLLAEQVLYVALGNNKLGGPIPTSVGKLTQLQQLDLSSNSLSGQCPPFLFALPSLKYLNIARNRLSGKLPSNLTFSGTLQMLDLSFNLLSGRLPSQIISSVSQGLAIRFQGNCFSTNLQPQNPVSYCENAARASSFNPHLSVGNSQRNRVALWAGIAGGFVALCFAFVILLVVILRRKVRQPLKPSKGSCMGNISVAVSSELLSNARYISQTMKLGALGFPQFRVFSIEEVYKATHHFHDKTFVGEGSRGKVYKGQLEDGSLVAIKRLKKDYTTTNIKGLNSRLDRLGKCHHQHLVSLLGYGIEKHDDASGDRWFLVYEFVSNRTLRTLLSGREPESFGWMQRLVASTGAAKGIHFLHSGVVPGIFDNDIKATSILLDQNLAAKVSDYGLGSRLDAEEKEAKSAHIANSLFLKDKTSREKIVDKGDVFNFGLVLLEIMLGKPPTMDASGRPKELVLLTAEQGPGLDAIDPKIVGNCSMESLGTVVEITAKCLSEDPRSRPSMEDVLWNLQYAIQVQDSSKGGSQDEIAVEGSFPEPKHQSKGKRNTDMMGNTSNEEMGKPSSPNTDFFR